MLNVSIHHTVQNDGVFYVYTFLINQCNITVSFFNKHSNFNITLLQLLITRLAMASAIGQRLNHKSLNYILIGIVPSHICVLKFIYRLGLLN